MASRLRRFLARFRGSSLLRGDHISGADRPVENTDALAATRPQMADPAIGGGHTFPPGYVKSYDEGRPRK